tara:strand:- start:4148 stop:5800 length:1653 start_codon:yes stop_codon:yes gene_type:complete
LHAKNFTIIDDIEINFNDGMTVLTGETGAGKSILIDALSLVIGERGNSTLIKDKEKRAEFTADFDISSNATAKSWLNESSLDDELECVLRRIISPDGRSKAFINGNQVNLQSLKQLGELLVDIHGQHFHQSLGKQEVQRTLIDHFGQLISLRNDIKIKYDNWRSLSKKLADIESFDKNREAKLDLLEFQHEELESLAIEKNEYESNIIEYSRLHNTEKITAGINQIIDSLHDSEITNVYSLMSNSIKSLNSLIDYDDKLIEAKTLLDEAAIHSSEAIDFLKRYQSRIEFNPERAHQLDERINAIKSIARKHHVEPNELHNTQEQIKKELNNINNSALDQKQLIKQTEEALDEYIKLAAVLSKKRLLCAKKLSSLVTEAMSSLGMPNGIFEISIDSNESISVHGMDDISFLISANPGQAPQSISKIASGGELSRMSLAIQVIASEGNYIPTMVFDEVDSGVGGAVAEMVGLRLKELGENRQVLCVTHLPQVASQAKSHIKINKMTDGKSTKVHLTNLMRNSRVEEIARMLGGIKVTKRTREHAAEMLEIKG